MLHCEIFGKKINTTKPIIEYFTVETVSKNSIDIVFLLLIWYKYEISINVQASLTWARLRVKCLDSTAPLDSLSVVPVGVSFSLYSQHLPCLLLLSAEKLNQAYLLPNLNGTGDKHIKFSRLFSCLANISAVLVWVRTALLTWLMLFCFLIDDHGEDWQGWQQNRGPANSFYKPIKAYILVINEGPFVWAAVLSRCVVMSASEESNVKMMKS